MEACVLISSETAGPFPLDLTENQTFFRQDVRESEQGVKLNLKLKIFGLNNCEPMRNLRVNIWHLDTIPAIILEIQMELNCEDINLLMPMEKWNSLQYFPSGIMAVYVTFTFRFMLVHPIRQFLSLPFHFQ